MHNLKGKVIRMDILNQSRYAKVSEFAEKWCASCCGACGYPLNLTSSNRATSSISSKYRRSISKAFVSFLSIDVSRFTQVDEVNCLPICWGNYRSKTKFLCRKCGVFIGYGYCDSSALCGLESPTSSSASYKKIMVKILALQPSEDL